MARTPSGPLMQRIDPHTRGHSPQQRSTTNGPSNWLPRSVAWWSARAPYIGNVRARRGTYDGAHAHYEERCATWIRIGDIDGIAGGHNISAILRDTAATSPCGPPRTRESLAAYLKSGNVKGARSPTEARGIPRSPKTWPRAVARTRASLADRERAANDLLRVLSAASETLPLSANLRSRSMIPQGARGLYERAPLRSRPPPAAGRGACMERRLSAKPRVLSSGHMRIPR